MDAVVRCDPVQRSLESTCYVLSAQAGTVPDSATHQRSSGTMCGGMTSPLRRADGDVHGGARVQRLAGGRRGCDPV